MTVPDATEFLTDMVSQNAVKGGIATAHSTIDHTVLPSSVKLTVTANSRRLVAAGRRLAGSVKVAYTITVSVDSGALAVVAALAQAVTAEQLTTAIQTSVSAEKGASFTISVTSKAEPVVKQVTISSTTATPTMKTTTSTTTTTVQKAFRTAPAAEERGDSLMHELMIGSFVTLGVVIAATFLGAAAYWFYLSSCSCSAPAVDAEPTMLEV